MRRAENPAVERRNASSSGLPRRFASSASVTVVMASAIDLRDFAQHAATSSRHSHMRAGTSSYPGRVTQEARSLGQRAPLHERSPLVRHGRHQQGLSSGKTLSARVPQRPSAAGTACAGQRVYGSPRTARRRYSCGVVLQLTQPVLQIAPPDPDVAVGQLDRLRTTAELAPAVKGGPGGLSPRRGASSGARSSGGSSRPPPVRSSTTWRK